MKEDYSKDQRGKPPTEQRLLHTFTQGASNRTSGRTNGRRVLSTSSYEGHAKHIDNPPGSRPRSLRKTLERYLAVRLTATGTLGVEWQCNSRQPVRSGPSGSATHSNRYVQGRVAVHFTLPLGIERTDAVRSGSSGSATGTLRAEWQCTSHCHSMVNVRVRYAQGRVAVRLTSTGTLRVEWQCRPRRHQIRKCHVSVRMRPK